MGLALADLQGKGLISVAISHFSDEYMTLYRNEGALNIRGATLEAINFHPVK